RKGRAIPGHGTTPALASVAQVEDLTLLALAGPDDGRLVPGFGDGRGARVVAIDGTGRAPPARARVAVAVVGVPELARRTIGVDGSIASLVARGPEDLLARGLVARGPRIAHAQHAALVTGRAAPALAIANRVPERPCRAGPALERSRAELALHAG